MPVDVSSALNLKINHQLTYAEIAAIQGVTPQAIHQRIKDLLPHNDVIQPFKDQRADILANAQLKALEAFIKLDNDETKDLIKRRGMVDMGILYDKERLERDLSTSNTALVHSDIKALGELQRQRRGKP